MSLPQTTAVVYEDSLPELKTNWDILEQKPWCFPYLGLQLGFSYGLWV